LVPECRTKPQAQHPTATEPGNSLNIYQKMDGTLTSYLRLSGMSARLTAIGLVTAYLTATAIWGGFLVYAVNWLIESTPPMVTSHAPSQAEHRTR
jgi:hypothetical protein